MRGWRLLTGTLRDAPAAIPALAAIALMIAWATGQAGYPLTHWAPGGLILLALLAIAAVAAPLRAGEIPGTVRLALGALAAYAVLSFCSIAWASDPGAAWEGADRTLVYLLVFALFALWPMRGAGAALLICAWTLALAGVAVYVALRLDSVTGSGYRALFTDERLMYPSGYANASAAQWGMALWPALLLARSRELPWALRGLLAAAAVVFADLALFSLSRGSILGGAVTLVLVFALMPGRVRTFATLLPVAGAIAVAAPFVLRVGDRIAAGHAPYAATHAAIAAAFLAAAAAGLAVALGAALESSRALSPRVRRGVGQAFAAAAVTGALAVAGVGLAVAGDPIARARSAWHSFKGGYSTNGAQPRLLSGLGSNRYDFYRVALDEYLAHPLAGIGADNFAQQYLSRGHSDETPRYPHSVELRTLAQTGSLGGLLAIVGLGAALAGGWRALRRHGDTLGAGVAAGALAGFGYWSIHGSFDWFWEFAGLGAPAFALLGIACALVPRRAGWAPGTTAARRMRSAVTRSASRATAMGRSARVALVVLGGVAALAAAYALAAPWLSERQVQSAAQIWPKAPLAAYARLDDAASLNPLSDHPWLVAGSIALRFGDLARARELFALASKRVPNGAYATLELGAIASASGEPTRALRLLRRAERLNPREGLAREALAVVASGRRLSVATLNRAIFARAEKFK